MDFWTTQTFIALLNKCSNRVPKIIEINDGQCVVKAVTIAVQPDDNGNVLHFGAKSEDTHEKTFQNFKIFVGSNDNTYQLQNSQGIYTPDKLAFLFLTQLKKLIEECYFKRIQGFVDWLPKIHVQ